MQNFSYDSQVFWTRLVSGAFLQPSHSSGPQNQEGDDGNDPQGVQRSNVPSNGPDYLNTVPTTGHHMLAAFPNV